MPRSPLVRPHDGRLLGGVCAALARQSGRSAGQIRLAVALASLLLGLGAAVYLAAWLILPGEGEEVGVEGRRGVVVLAQVAGAAAGLCVLGGAGALASLFGYGWVSVAVAATVLGAALAAGERVRPAWALLPVGVLALPSVALAAAGLHLEPVGAQALAPASVAELPGGAVRSGVEPLLVDLRRTALPVGGVVPLRIEAGVRRTIVALPHDRCVRVEVRYDVGSFAARAASALTRRAGRPTSTVTLFGQVVADRGVGRVAPRGAAPGPVLRLDFRSQGGGLYVRDYPDGRDPRTSVDYPGYAVTLESRPDTTGLGPRRTRYRLEQWRIRRAEQERSKRRVDRLMPGPCAPEEVRR